VKYQDGVAAFNDFDGGLDGVGLDQYDKLYSDGKYEDFHDSYAGVEQGMIGSNGGKSDDELSIESIDGNDYDTHNKGVTKESLDSAMNKMMSERKEQDDVFDKMKTDEFGSALDDKYGISKQFGFILGNDKFGHQKNIKRRNIQEETLKAYKQLTDK